MIARILPYLVALLLALPAAAQGTPASSQALPAPQQAVPFTSVSEANALLSQLESTAQGTAINLARLRIDKWKTDSHTKQQLQANTDSILRNLQSALPGMIAAVRTSPDDMGLNFKLYRNLDALYDVITTVAESAGAFGPKSDYQSLAVNVDQIERVRRSFADRLENLATIKEAELSRLRADVRASQSNSSVSNKKVVVDDTEPPVKKPRKKKAAPKPATSENKSPAPTPPGQKPSTPQ